MSQVIYLSQMTLVYFGAISQGKLRTDISYPLGDPITLTSLPA